MKVLKEETVSARIPKWKREAVERLIEVVPGLTWSSAINDGLDMVIQKFSAQLAQERSLREHKGSQS
jgi:hypothetical protein